MFDRLTQLFHGGDPLSIAIELLLIFGGVMLILRFLQGTRGAGVFKGIIVLVAVLVLGIRFAGLFSEAFPRLRFLSEGLLGAIAIFMLVIFQPELRQAMVRIGQTMSPSERRRIDPVIDALESAVEFLSRNQFGALIVIERGTSLAGLAAQGVSMDAAMSAELIESIFWPSSPLHDLAVVIRGEKIAAASVQLPLADPVAGMKLGARHRAAMGATLESDCVVVVVSEENGLIRFAEGVDLEPGVLADAEGRENVVTEREYFDVGLRLGDADALDVDLVELAQASLLRTLVTEQRPVGEEPHRQLLRQSFGNEGAHDAGGELRAQGHALAATIGERVHLLGDDVRRVAEGALEYFGELEHRRRHLGEAVALGELARDIDNAAMAERFFRQQVVGAPNGLQLGHGGERR